MNAREQLTGATFGSSLSASYGFDSYGYPSSTSADTLQDYRYSFDPVTGNLNSRQNYKRSLSESFLYDNLERLTTVNGPQNLAMTYSANGNIQTKSDISPSTAFTYGTNAGPYALTGVTSSTGIIPTASQTATYNSFGKVSSITEGAFAASFVYNSDNQRAKMMVTQSGSTILTRWYVGSRYMKETASGVTKEFTYLGGDAYSAPVVAITQSGTTSYFYLLRDYLGNITHQVNTSNAVVAEYNFDAWGRRRSADDWSYTLDANDLNLVADRGFTGHEFLKYFNLYNMNGRLYDPLVGRFLNADPYVQLPDFSQNYNRYTYCLNNPLKYSDPSGMRWAGPENDSSIDAINTYFGFMADVSGTWKLPGGGGGGSFNSSWNRYESFWSSLLASVPYMQSGPVFNSRSFGKKNGVEGVWINTVNVGTPKRVGEVGSSNFKAFFFVDFTRKFIGFNNAAGGGVHGAGGSWGDESFWGDEGFARKAVDWILAGGPVSKDPYIGGTVPLPGVGSTGKYVEMAKLTQGYKGAIQAHHLVEARHLELLGKTALEAPAVVLDKVTHQTITNTLRTEMPYGKAYTTEQMMNTYQKVYSPQWMDYVKILLGY